MLAGKRELKVLNCGDGEVYADGVKAEGPTSTSSFDYSIVVNTYQIPENTSVLAVMSKCPDNMKRDVRPPKNNFMAWSYIDIATDERWKCKVSAQTGWKGKEFVDNLWDEARQHDIGDAIFGAPEAVFIGTSQMNPEKLYCRVVLGEYKL